MNIKSKNLVKISEITLEGKSIASITVSFCTKKPMGYFGFEQKRKTQPENRYVAILEVTVVSWMESNMS